MRCFDSRFRKDIFIRFNTTFEAFGDLQGKTVIDIGAGSGPYVIEAFRRGATHVTALDPAPGMLRLAKERLQNTDYLQRCNFIESLFPNPELDIELHDHAIVMGVMDYVSDTKAFMESLRRIVKVSAAISFPSVHWFRTPVRKFRYRLRSCPLYFYDSQEIERLSDKAGFKDCSIAKIPGAGMDYHVVVKP
jgi:ubiquinone/menaquinone biosynthesis C-methylase UbiE